MVIMNTTILIAEDEHTVREVVRKYIEHENFSVIEARDGVEALNALGRHAFDLLVLDIMLPGVDGLTIMRRLRQIDAFDIMAPNREVPVIMLTARSEEEDRITGFEVGADDYVTKPFSPRELMMRIKAVLRRSISESSTPSDTPLEFTGLRLEPDTRLVIRDGKSVTLTAKEFELLWHMASAPRQVFSRTQLLDHIWGHEYYGDESTVTVHIHRLREKIEPDATKPTYIHTVWGVGYKFEVV